MNANQVNVLVDIKQVIDRQTSDMLAGELGGLQGLNRTWVSKHVPRLWFVDYDPQLIDSQQILATFTQRGFDAHLVDM